MNEGETIAVTMTLDAMLTDGLVLIANATFSGTATNGSDYTSGSQSGGVYRTRSFSFLGSTVSQVETNLLSITDDDATEGPEGPETITWTWAIHPSSTTTDTVTLSHTSFTVTIRSNDGYVPPTPTFSIAVDEATRTEGQSAVFTVTLAGSAPAGGVTVDWAISGAGITPADYTLSGADTDGTLSFTATGDQTLTFAITDDSAGEGDETLTVTLSNPSAGSITTAAASTAITDNDTVLTVTGPTSIAEGVAATYTVTLTGAAFASATMVDWAVTHGTTTADDFTGATSGMVSFAATDTHGATKTFTLTAAEDGEVDAGTFTLNVTAPSGASAGPALTVMITEPSGGDTTHELLLPEVTRAVADGVFGAVAARAGEFHVGGSGSAGFSLNGRSTWSDIVATQARALAAGDGALSRHPRSPSPRHPRSLLSGGDIDAKQLLRGLEFASPVAMGASHGGHGHANLAFWGGSDYRDFGGEDGDDDWDGSVFSLRFGVDGAVRDNLRAGLMLSYSDAETEYTRIDTGTTVTGDYELEMTSVSPYLRWNLGGGHAWASVSYGSGEVEVRPDDGETAANDVTMTGAAFGGGRKLLAQGGRELSVRADAFVASSEVDGDGDSNAAGIDEDLDVDANRVRVALAWSYPGRFADGRLAPAFDLGIRHDGGDGRTGAGLELGGALRYRAADAGLTLEGNARALLGHSGDHRGWGVGGLVRVQNGADGQGLAVSIAPSYGGMAGDGDSQLWGRGWASAGRSIAKPAARLDAEVGYGVPMTVSGDSRLGRAFGFDAGEFGDGMLTPYSALRLGDNRDYRLGLRWAATRLDIDVFARTTDGTVTDNALAVEGRLRF